MVATRSNRFESPAIHTVCLSIHVDPDFGTLRVFITREILWLNQTYGEYDGDKRLHNFV